MRYRQTLLAWVAGIAAAGVAHAQETQPMNAPPSQQETPGMQPATGTQPATGMPEANMPAGTQPGTPEGTTPEQPPACEVPAPPPMYAPQPAPVAAAPVQHEKKRNYWFSPLTALTVGGGVADYSFSTMRNATEPGAQWDARIVIGTRSFFGFEAGYAGTYNKMESPVEGGGAVAPYIVNNSVDGALRLNFLPFRIQPYGFVGAGYNRASVNNLNDNPAMAAQFNSSDNQFLLPAGGGFAFYPWRHTTFDVRYTYRAIFSNDLLVQNSAGTNNGRVDQWVVNGRLGYVF
jgi:hypothetical protein